METKYTYKKSKSFFIGMGVGMLLMLLGGLLCWYNDSRGWAILGWVLASFFLWLVLRRNQKIAFQALKARERRVR